MIGASKIGIVIGASKIGIMIGASKIGITIGASKIGVTIGASKIGIMMGTFKTNQVRQLSSCFCVSLDKCLNLVIFGFLAAWSVEFYISHP